MNTLYFVKFIDRGDYDRIVFCLTASTKSEAESKGRSMISESWRHRYTTDSIEPICQTPDTVTCFEPV
jgi:hypothetical protein